MGPDWVKLVSEGRAKAINVPFSDEDWENIKGNKKTPKDVQNEWEKEQAAKILSVSTVTERKSGGESDDIDVANLPNKGAVIEAILEKAGMAEVPVDDELLAGMNRKELNAFYSEESNFTK